MQTSTRRMIMSKEMENVFNDKNRMEENDRRTEKPEKPEKPETLRPSHGIQAPGSCERAFA